MGENLPDDRRALDDGDDLHPPPATRTEERIDLVDLADEAGPSRLRASREPQPNASTQAGAADLQGRPVVRAGEWVRRFGFREQPVLLAVAPRAIGVPAVEERGLLVRVRLCSGGRRALMILYSNASRGKRRGHRRERQKRS